MASGQRKFDLVVFGASGFTGTYVVEEILRLERQENVKPFSWAVAGRSRGKLEQTLKSVSKCFGKDLSQVNTIVAHVDDIDSLREMAKQAKVVLNCVGPYRFYGENVVKACIAEGASHVDLSGEPQFLEGTQVKYHKEAEAKGVYIIGSCGFDSIPADVGAMYLQQNFDGDLESLDIFFNVESEPGKPLKVKIHYGTYQSFIHWTANSHELAKLREKLFSKNFPASKYFKQRPPIYYSDDMKGYYVPFVGYDADVVKRSQYQLYHQEGKRPVQANIFTHSYNYIFSVLAILSYFIFTFMTKFKLLRAFLENYPRLCTLGMVSHEGPTKEEGESVLFTWTLIGEGFSEKLTEPTDQHVGKPDKRMKLVISGQNPGYSGTAKIFIQSALTILHESDKMPSKGGVFAPGFAFRNTTIAERLNANGITFSLKPLCVQCTTIRWQNRMYYLHFSS